MPARVRGRGVSYKAKLPEMEADEDMDAPVAEELQDEAQREYAQGDEDDSDADAEVGEEEDFEDDDGEIVGAVKTRSRLRRQPVVNKVSEDEEFEAQEEQDDESEAESSKDGEQDWEAADDMEEDQKLSVLHASSCIFCQLDEEHDPSDEFEEYLACSVCGDNSHRQCARNARSLAPDQDAAHWRCPECVANGLEEDFKHVSDVLTTGRRASAPKMARDLLPAARGGIKPGSHSVFNTLILPDDEMDGSRSLRKRKTPSAEVDESAQPPVNRKRAKSSEMEDAPTFTVNGHASHVDELADDEEVAEDAASPRSRSGRPQRNLKAPQKGARIISRSDHPKSAILAIPITPAQWDQVERDVVKKQKRRERDRQRRRRNTRHTATAEPEDPAHVPAVQTSMYTNPFFPFQDREVDESKAKPYGGILTEAEADTTRTYPDDADRQAFQDARDRADQQWEEKKMAETSGETPARSKQAAPASKIKCINFGHWEIDTWHAAPYPEEYSRNKHLYICEFCLKYMGSDLVAWRHKLKCAAKHPPGDEIYRDNVTDPETGVEKTLSFFEVDGRRNPLYCQNLCLLAKLFLGSKTLYYDVEPFLFYIVTENDEFGCHFVGYFSKEKRGSGPPPPMNPPHTSFEGGQAAHANGITSKAPQSKTTDPALNNPGNNVSCILVLPVHMRRGFGKVLIDFSYLLTKVEGRTGSPEKPLSDMGLVSYRSYWRLVICKFLLRYQSKEAAVNQGGVPAGAFSIVGIAKKTGMTPDDIISTLEGLRFLVRDPVTRKYALRLDYEVMKEYIEKQEKKTSIRIDPERLRWTPYVMGRPTNLFPIGEETNRSIQTVAAREDPAAEKDDKEIQVANGGPPPDDETIAVSTEANGKPQVNGLSLKSRKTTPPPQLELSQLSLAGDGRNTSPTRRSPRRATPGASTIAPPPQPDSGEPSPFGSFYSGSQPADDYIPPSRYEIFPPIPGMPSAKRKAGRPVGSRGSRRSDYGTPARRNAGRKNQQHASLGNMVQPSNPRRTRSKLADVALAADDEDATAAAEEAVEDGDAEVEPQLVDPDPEADAEYDEDADAPGEDDDDIQYE